MDRVAEEHQNKEAFYGKIGRHEDNPAFTLPGTVGKLVACPIDPSPISAALHPRKTTLITETLSSYRSLPHGP